MTTAATEPERVLQGIRPYMGVRAAHEVATTSPSQRVPLNASGALPMPEGQLPAPPVRLYPSAHRVSMTRYATSTDPRGYIPVYEYQIAGAANPQQAHTIMIDCETGYVQFTGIWKALGHLKADVVKLIESAPEIASQVKKVRGGYLKIQGTWVPFDTARTLARRVAYHLRQDLVPIFGPSFVDECLQPGQPGFGQLLLSQPKQRASSGRRPRVDRTQLPYGQSDVYGRPPPPSAFHPMPMHSHHHHPQSLQTPLSAVGPQRRPAMGMERYQPYGMWAQVPHHHQTSMPVTPYAHLPTPPPTAWSSMHPGATWRQGYEGNHAVPLMQQTGNTPMSLPVAKSYVGRGFPTTASDQDAISSLMSMASRTPTFAPTPKTAGYPSPLYSLPSSHCISPKTATAPAPLSAPHVPSMPVTTSSPLPSVSAAVWSTGLLLPQGRPSLTRAHESNMRSGSAEPVHKEDSHEQEMGRAKSAPPLISPKMGAPIEVAA